MGYGVKEVEHHDSEGGAARHVALARVDLVRVRVRVRARVRVRVRARVRIRVRVRVRASAVDAPVAAEQPAVPLVLARGRRARERAAEGAHSLRGGVDHEHRLGKLRDAVDAPVVRAEDAAVPLPLAGHGLADLGAHALARRAVDPQDLVRVARDAVDAAVRSRGAAEPLVLALVGAADQRDLGGDRVELEHLLRVPGHTVDAAISTEDAAEPLVLTG